MSADREEERWIARTRQALDDDVAGLDGATLSRLNRARQGALDAQGRPRLKPAWLGAGAAVLAASLVLAVALRIDDPAIRPPIGEPSAAADFELISSEESIELYEDQEFYAWLDAQSSSSG